MNILIADDNAGVRQVLRRVLTSSLQADVLEVDSGEGAIEALSQGGVDLVILDIEMGLLDGAETLEVIRGAPDFQSLPVIMVSGATSEVRVRQLKGLGVQGFIAKPLSLQVLRERLVPLVQRLAGARDTTAGGTRCVPESLSLGPSSRVLFVGETESYWRPLLAPLRHVCNIQIYSTTTSALKELRASPPALICVAGSTAGLLTPVLFARAVRREVAARLPLVFCGSSEGIGDQDRDLFDAVLQTPTVSGWVDGLKAWLSNESRARVLLQQESPAWPVVVDSIQSTLQSAMLAPIRELSGSVLDAQEGPAFAAVAHLEAGDALWLVAMAITPEAAVEHASRLAGMEPGLIPHHAVLEATAELSGRVASRIGEVLIEWDVVVQTRSREAAVSRWEDWAVRHRHQRSSFHYFAIGESDRVSIAVGLVPLVKPDRTSRHRGLATPPQ